MARGLLHHYFGGRRELYREVVRSMLRYPLMPAEDGAELTDALDRWLTMIARNRAAWLAALSARDPEVQAVVDAAREEAVERLVARFGGREDLRPALRCYSAFAETASVEWLVRRRLTREQVRALLLRTLTHLTRGER